MDMDADVQTAIAARCWRYDLVDDPHFDQDTSPCVCFEPFERGQDLLRLPCMHRYHFACVARWFQADTADQMAGGFFQTVYRLRCPYCYVSIREM